MAGFSQVVLVCANQTAKHGESNLHMPWVFSFAAAQRPQPLLSCMHSCQSSSNLPNIKRKQGLENDVPPAHVGAGKNSDRYPTLQDQHISTHFFCGGMIRFAELLKHSALAYGSNFCISFCLAKATCGEQKSLTSGWRFGVITEKIW